MARDRNAARKFESCQEEGATYQRRSERGKATKCGTQAREGIIGPPIHMRGTWGRAWTDAKRLLNAIAATLNREGAQALEGRIKPERKAMEKK